MTINYSLVTNTTDVVDFTDEYASIALNHGPVERVIICLALIIIIVLTVIGNVLVMLSIACLKWMRTLSNVFVFSLAVADMLVGLCVMPWSVVVQWNNGYWYYGRTFCLMWISWDVYFSTISIVHFSCLAIDRYIAISDPFRYTRVLGKPMACCLIVFCWVSPGFISFLPIFKKWNIIGIEHLEAPPDIPACFLMVNRYFAVICSLIAFYIPLAAIVFCYWRIFAIARVQARKIHALHISSGGEGDDGRNKSLTRIKRDTKAAKTLAIIVGAFSACYLPFFCMNVLDPFFDNSLDNTQGHKIWICLTWLGYCNSMINPFIYYVSNRSFRTAFKQILLCNIRARFVDDNDLTLYQTNRGNGYRRNQKSSPPVQTVNNCNSSNGSKSNQLVQNNCGVSGGCHAPNHNQITAETALIPPGATEGTPC